jgi:hypothetical protein
MKVVLVILACSYLNPIRVENCKMEYVHGLSEEKCREIAWDLNEAFSDRYPVNLGCLTVGGVE